MKKVIFKIKRFFGLEEHEIDEVYEDEVEVQQRPKVVEQPVEKPRPKVVYQQPLKQAVQQVEEEQPVQKKKTFRFPLIDDREPTRDVKEQKQEPQSAVFKKTDDDTLRLPKHISASPEVLDVEVSGIRQLLEKRGRTVGKNVVRIQREEAPTRKRQTVTEAEATFLTRNPSRQDTQPTVTSTDFINPMENKKRFTPTHVPSPVYGFQEPRPIRELLKEERNFDAHIPVVFAAEEVVPIEECDKLQPIEDQLEEPTVTPVEQHDEEPIATPQPDEQVVQSETVAEQVQVMQQSEVAETVIEEPTHSQATVEQALLQAVEEPVTAPKEASDVHRISELQLQNVTFENSTVHIGQIHVEPSPTVENPSGQQQTSHHISEEIKSTKAAGSKLPFNVLMLKSDKEKIQTNPLDALKTGVPKTIVDKVEMRRDAQNGLKSAGIPLPKELQDDEDSDLATKPKVEDEQLALEDAPVVEEQRVEPPLDDIEQQLLENYKATQQQVAESLVTAPTAVATLEREDELEELLERAEDDLDEELLAAAPLNEEPPATFDLDDVMEMEQQLQTIVETVHPQPVEEPMQQVQRYEKPPFNYLVPPEEKTEDFEWMDEQAGYLLEALQSHQIQAQVESIVQGPAVTQFEITVAAGTKVSKVRNLSDDIKLALAAKDIRIDAPIPGKRTIGIEIPNRIARAVRLSEVTESDTFKESDSPLEAALGLDLNGKPVTLDLRKMPHGLIAGATGSGKSVCINSILVSLLYKADPHELKLMLIDPKMVELAPFNRIPHLVSPVITDVKAATAALKWAVEEMERRYELFMHAGVRDITRYNSQAEKAGQHAQKMPYLLIVIDELADLMMMSPADVEEAICRIAQKARACGIHLIVATQRPSVDVITGLIKSNIPTRIAFAVSSAVDSRTILDGQGAERLLGRGDMLYLGNGMSAPVRLQGTFVTDDEIEEIIDYVRSQGEPNYLFQHEELLKKAEFVEEQDELFEEVCRYVYEQGSASTSAIQRRYHLGYNRAARLVDMLERNGFVSEQRGSKPREVFITEADLENLFS